MEETDAGSHYQQCPPPVAKVPQTPVRRPNPARPRPLKRAMNGEGLLAYAPILLKAQKSGASSLYQIVSCEIDVASFKELDVHGLTELTVPRTSPKVDGFVDPINEVIEFGAASIGNGLPGRLISKPLPGIPIHIQQPVRYFAGLSVTVERIVEKRQHDVAGDAVDAGVFFHPTVKVLPCWVQLGAQAQEDIDG